MFETNDQARLPSLFAEKEGEHRWAYIAQTANDEWFYVTHEIRGVEGSLNQFMVPNAVYLLGFASSDSDESFIKEIQLVSPPWMNATCRWQMEPLAAIRLVDGRFCYELANGKTYPSELEGKPGNIAWMWRGAGGE